MALRVRFRFDGRCSVHPGYNPEKDGRPQHKDCPGCESLWVVHLYTGIARRKGENGEGIIVPRPEVHADSTIELPDPDQASALADGQEGEAEDHNTPPQISFQHPFSPAI
jgi:hypothetical protein